MNVRSQSGPRERKREGTDCPKPCPKLSEALSEGLSEATMRYAAGVPRKASDLERAWRAIAFFFGEHPDLPRELDLGLMDAIAHLHRLDAPLADPRLTQVSPARHLPPWIWTRWRQAHAAALAQSVRRFGALQRALAALDPLPAIVLKGAATAELLYPSPGARILGDVDLLVRAPDLEPALARLAPSAIRKAYPTDPILDAPGYHERQLGGPEFELDLHQGFLQPQRVTVDYAALFSRALPWPALGPNARLLAPEDAVAYLCLSAATGELTPSATPASTYLDLRLMLCREGPLWGQIGPPLNAALVTLRAAEWGTERMLFCVLQLAGRLFPSLAARLPPFAPRLPRGVRRLLSTAVVARAAHPGLADPSRPEILLRKALLMPPRARLRFARDYFRDALAAKIGQQIGQFRA